MLGLAKPLKVLGIIAGVLGLFLALYYFSERRSLLLWAAVFSLLLPLAFWLRRGFEKCCAAGLLIALALAISPIDIVIMRLEAPGLRLLPTSYGIVCQPGTFCYGCIVHNPPRRALVLSY
jgi:hypothetical protein